MMHEFQIEFYKKDNGSQPAKEFVRSLDVKMRAKMLRTIEVLRANGNELRESYTKPLEDGIFELRAKQGTDISRVLYFFVVGKKIVLTNGFIKKTQKTPQREINLAQTYRKDYLEKWKGGCE